MADPGGGTWPPGGAAGVVGEPGWALPPPLEFGLVAMASISAVAEPDGAGVFSDSAVGAGVSSAGDSSALGALGAAATATRCRCVSGVAGGGEGPPASGGGAESDAA
jgi:hypothetical protein